MQRAPLRPPGTGVGSLRGRVDRRLPRRGQKPPTRGILAPLETRAMFAPLEERGHQQGDGDGQGDADVRVVRPGHPATPPLQAPPRPETERRPVDGRKPRADAQAHDKVHAVFTETQLARDYHSVDSLLADPDISKFVRWIQKRPIDFSDSTMSVRRRQQRMQRRK